MNKELKAIPTNLVTGFLGVGKTSAILHLLKQKPANETWAVLVNEFGALGIDGEILADQGAYVEQVPGGCICCAQGLPFEVAINRLVQAARPDRLIIEPSGLAHPHRIIQQLSQGYFSDLLLLQATVCLVDARHFSDQRYLNNEMFIDQIALADVLLANKTDLATVNDLTLFEDWATRFQPDKAYIAQVSHGEIKPVCLTYPRFPQRKPEYENSHSDLRNTSDFHSRHKTYSTQVVFKKQQLLDYLSDNHFDRLKAILHTDDGWYVFNQAEEQLAYYQAGDMSESRIEVLDKSPKKLEAFFNRLAGTDFKSHLPLKNLQKRSNNKQS